MIQTQAETRKKCSGTDLNLHVGPKVAFSRLGNSASDGTFREMQIFMHFTVSFVNGTGTAVHFLLTPWL